MNNIHERLELLHQKLANADMMQQESAERNLQYEVAFYGGCYQAFKDEIKFLDELLIVMGLPPYLPGFTE